MFCVKLSPDLPFKGSIFVALTYLFYRFDNVYDWNNHVRWRGHLTFKARNTKGLLPHETVQITTNYTTYVIATTPLPGKFSSIPFPSLTMRTLSKKQWILFPASVNFGSPMGFGLIYLPHTTKTSQISKIGCYLIRHLYHSPQYIFIVVVFVMEFVAYFPFPVSIHRISFKGIYGKTRSLGKWNSFQRLFAFSWKPYKTRSW